VATKPLKTFAGRPGSNIELKKRSVSFWTACVAKNPLPSCVGESIHDSIPQSAYVVTDLTQIAYSFRANIGREFPAKFFHPKGYGTLGYGLPAAIGAKIGKPD
jgi:thiamine pyrophosphate-dependent acetolactate synthase large subunit-like protein